MKTKIQILKAPTMFSNPPFSPCEADVIRVDVPVLIELQGGSAMNSVGLPLELEPLVETPVA